MKCLENIIGITPTDCGCIVDGLSTEVKAKLKLSTSGLFGDDLEGLPQLRSSMNLEACKSMAQLALDARDEAIRRLEGDLLIGINSLYKKAKNNYLGTIGQLSYAGSLPANKKYQGQRWRANGISDAIIKISRLQIIVSQDIATEVLIIRALPGSAMGETIYTLPVDADANIYKNVPLPDNLPISLPLTVNGQPAEYYLLYDRGTANPKDNKTECLPCQKGGQSSIAQYIQVNGAQVESLGELNTVTNGDIYARGLIADVDIRCNNETLVCREYDANDVIALAMSYTVRFKYGELLIEKIMSSGEINRYTTMNREFLWGKRNSYKKEYTDRIAYLASVIDVGASDCYVCKESRMFYSGILS